MNKPSVRIDKNISFNYLYFKKHSQDDSKLMFLLLIFFAKERQQNLFGFGELDSLKFCQEMGLTPNHTIWTKHDNPLQLQKYTREELETNEIPIFDTILENSLYSLLTNVYEFSDKDSFMAKAGIYQKQEKIKSIQFIKSLKKIERPVGKTTKRFYQYELSKEFLENLSFVFFNLNIRSLSLSIKKSYEGLYFLLSNHFNEMNFKKERKRELDFTDIKERLNINSDRVDYIKQKIKKAFKEILEFPDLKDKLKIEWFTKEKQRFEYGIHLICNNNFMESKVREKKESVWQEVRTEFLKNALFEAFLRRYPGISTDDKKELKHKYIKWLIDKEIDEETKKTVYFDMCARFDNPTMPIYRKIYEQWLHNLKDEYPIYL